MVLSPANCELVVLVHPGEFAGNQLQQKNQEVLFDSFNFQQAGKSHAKRAIYASWTDEIKRMQRDENDSLEYRLIGDHYEALFLAFPVTHADITTLKAAVQKPYQRTDNIEALRVLHRPRSQERPKSLAH